MTKTSHYLGKKMGTQIQEGQKLFKEEPKEVHVETQFSQCQNSKKKNFGSLGAPG